MDLYYQNEILYVDIFNALDLDETNALQAKIFRIIDDYDVDRIIIHNKAHIMKNKHYLQQIRHQYNNKYQGRLYIK